MNLRPSGYEPDELPDCSTPRQRTAIIDGIAAVRNAIAENESSVKANVDLIDVSLAAETKNDIIVSLPRSAARVVPLTPQARTIFKLRSPNPYRAG